MAFHNRRDVNEEDARSQIVAYCARLYERGLVFGSSGNVSLRLEDGSLLVTPTGASLRALLPEELVHCDPAGTPLHSGTRPTSELPLHVAAYRVRPDIQCLIHTHPTYCVGWSKTGGLFPLDTVGALESLGAVRFTRYAKSGTQELADRCAAALRECDTVLMERHGVSCVGPTLESAFVRTDLLEATAHLEFAAILLLASKRAGMQNERPALPVDDFRVAAGDHPEARAAVDEFHAEYSAPTPDAARLGAHAERMRGYPDLLAPFERWWLEPRVQAFVAELGATGL